MTEIRCILCESLCKWLLSTSFSCWSRWPAAAMYNTLPLNHLWNSVRVADMNILPLLYLCQLITVLDVFTVCMGGFIVTMTVCVIQYHSCVFSWRQQRSRARPTRRSWPGPKRSWAQGTKLSAACPKKCEYDSVGQWSCPKLTKGVDCSKICHTTTRFKLECYSDALEQYW